ncbi:hypothetical protein J2D78_04450 [Microbacterium maritypicum]|uniref:hypothetical protein n=1 Tax=Microbacterium maritypicum TaxID=33918 RepID=UPI001B327ABA|nr:hypothetical protein [Microbacterium liquefaciens]MBP5801329.1 hypothetical protein [Microbacterium liquefaciens]
MTIGDWVQVVAVLAAISASLVALRIATTDRRTQREIARSDREHARLILELEYALRLSENLNHGGSTDPAETKRLGAEAMALAAVLGERWVPHYYTHLMDGRTVDQIAEAVETKADHMPEWVQWRNEATVAAQRIAARLNESD